MNIFASAEPGPLVKLVAVIVLGGAAQWLAWRLKLPSILLLLLCGFVAGPVTQFIDPDALFGALLRPFVAISVGLILFEGGLNLNFRELKGTGGVVRNLVSLGVLITGCIVAAAAYWIVGLDPRLSVLLGAILTVTGPTVILPMLRHVRPRGAAGAVLKWEGIVIDPIGALLAVLMYEVALAQESSSVLIVKGLAKTVLAGGGTGLFGALLMTAAIRRYWVPQFLQNSIAMLLVLTAFAGSNLIQAESGLLAVTVMGVAMANQRRADVRHIVEFKENLRVLLISALFILLSARLRLEDLASLGGDALLFLLVVLFVARPVAVLASTLGSSLRWSERMFLMCMAPRGIVAASVASIFALDMERLGFVDARLLVPLTFLTIVGTVLIYGLSAGPIARLLKLAERDPQGALVVGAHPFGRALAGALKANEIPVVLVDSNPGNISAARLAGHRTYLGSILGERALDEIDLTGIGRLVTLTPNDPVNILAVQRFLRIFGAANVYQVAPKTSELSTKQVQKELYGRILFHKDATYVHLDRCVARGQIIKVTRLSEEFTYEDFKVQYGADVLPLFTIGEDGALRFAIASDKPIEPKPGQRIGCLVDSDSPRRP